MPVTREQAEMLVEIAVACRPTGAPVWNRPGIFAAIGKVKGRSLASVTIAVVQAAEDRMAESPAVIASAGPHWRQPIPGDRPANFPPKAEVACRTCGKEVGGCVCLAPAMHLRAMDPEIAHQGAGMARALLDEKRGVPHNHTERVDGCFRCDLSADEAPAACAALQPTEVDAP
jgi:hypothetical protein